MNLPDLPALPEAYTRMPKTIPAGAGVALLSVVNVFTEDQLRAFALQYGRLVREECAKVCDREGAAVYTDIVTIHDAACVDCAAAIRAEE